MKIGFMVNDIRTEEAGYTTTRLAMSAIARGHQVYTIGAGDFEYAADGIFRARAYSVAKKHRSNNAYLSDLQGKDAAVEHIDLKNLDILMLRSDPSEDIALRPWAQESGIFFGRAIVQDGVIVLNDPEGLSRALNKMYFQFFPEEIRPVTIITRDAPDIKAFARDRGDIIIKPLQGSGGAGVFLVRQGNYSNLNQIIDSVCRDGYAIAQEYMTGAEDGDIRLFVMNGVPFQYQGKYAAFRRVRSGDDIRSNIHAGGKLHRAEITDKHLHIAEIVRPKLVHDGIFLAGLDIIGDKLTEINVFSPGGLGSAQQFEGVDFSAAVIDSLERKAEYMKYYGKHLNNAEICTL